MTNRAIEVAARIAGKFFGGKYARQVERHLSKSDITAIAVLAYELGFADGQAPPVPAPIPSESPAVMLRDAPAFDRTCDATECYEPIFAFAEVFAGTVALCKAHAVNSENHHLVAGIPNVWCGDAGPDEVVISEFDRSAVSLCTWRIRNAGIGPAEFQAFEKARLVWDRVTAARTATEAVAVLAVAGVDLVAGKH